MGSKGPGPAQWAQVAGRKLSQRALRRAAGISKLGTKPVPGRKKPKP